MIKVDRQKLGKNKFSIAFLFTELIVVVLAVYLFYKLLGLDFDFAARTLSFTPGLNLEALFFFVVSVVLLVAMHFSAKKRLPSLFNAQQLAKGTIKEKAVEKLSLAKNDPKASALLLIQFVFVMAVVITIVAWLDPEFELIPWSGVGIFDPLKTVLNAALAIIGLGFFYWLYSFTAWYRK